MLCINRIKKIIVLSLLITCIPSSMKAAWYDSFFATIKENITTIAAVAVGAASFFGALWFKSSLATKLKDQEIERLKKEAEEDKADSESEIDRLETAHESAKTQLNRERKLKVQAYAHLRSMRCRPVTLGSSIRKYRPPVRINAATKKDRTYQEEIDRLSIDNQKTAYANTTLKSRIRQLEAQLRKQKDPKIDGDLIPLDHSATTPRAATSRDRKTAVEFRATPRTMVDAQTSTEVTFHDFRADELFRSHVDNTLIPTFTKIARKNIKLKAKNTELKRQIAELTASRSMLMSTPSLGGIHPLATSFFDLQTQWPDTLSERKSKSEDSAPSPASSLTAAGPAPTLNAATASTAVVSQSADVQKSVAIVKRTAQAWVNKYKKLQTADKTKRLLQTYHANFITFAKQIEDLLLIPNLEALDRSELSRIKQACETHTVAITQLLNAFDESVDKVVHGPAPKEAPGGNDSLESLKLEIDEFPQKMKAAIDKQNSKEIKELEEDLVVLETHLTGVKNIQFELASYLPEGTEPKTVIELYQTNFAGTGVEPKSVYGELAKLGIFGNKTAPHIQQLQHSVLHKEILAAIERIPNKIEGATQVKKLRQLAWTFENKINKANYDAYISGKTPIMIPLAVRTAYAQKIDDTIGQIYTKKESIRAGLRELKSDDDWVNTEVIKGRRGAADSISFSDNFSAPSQPSPATASGWTSTFVALTGQFASQLKSKIIGTAATPASAATTVAAATK